MSGLRARIATTLATLALAACLSGCEIEGTVEVLSEQSLAVDVTLTGLYRGACNSLTSGLSDVEVERGRTPGGERYCKVAGTVDPAELRGLGLVPAGEYYVLTVGLDGVTSSWPSSDLTVRFPGQVVEASQGSVSGRDVRITDLSGLASGEELRLVALRRPGPPGWMIAAGLGLLGGAAATVALQRWWAARARSGSTEPDAVPSGAPEPDGPEPGVTALAAAAGAAPAEPDFDPEFFAPDRPGTQPGRPPEPSDPQVWAQPPQPETPVAAPDPAPAAPRPDHSQWRPPA